MVKDNKILQSKHVLTLSVGSIQIRSGFELGLFLIDYPAQGLY